MQLIKKGKTQMNIHSLVIIISILLQAISISEVYSCETNKIKVGDYEYKVFESPHPYPSANNDSAPVHKDIITYSNASYIVVHFGKFELAPNDYITISDPKDEVNHVYKDKGFAGLGTFFSLSVPGDTAVIKLYSHGINSSYYGYRVDYFVHGYPAVGSNEFLCGVVDYKDAKCYESTYPLDYAKSKAALRLLLYGTSTCSAVLVSCQNHVLANNHCLETQADVTNTEFQFMYQKPGCNFGDAVPELQLQGGTLLRSIYNYDYALVLPNLNSNDPQAVYGFVQLEQRMPMLGERIYIAGHPIGDPKKITIESDQSPDTGWLCRVQSLDEPGCWGVGPDIGYHCDTHQGSSGSPVVSGETHRAVALAHCGGGCMDLGVPIMLILNDIQNSSSPLPSCSYLSVPDLKYGSHAITDTCVFGGSGNGNGIVDPGENITLQIGLMNYSLPASGISAILTTNTPGVIITDDSAWFPDIWTNSTGYSLAPHFALHVDKSVACGTSINFELMINSNQEAYSTTFQIIVGEIIPINAILLNEDFKGSGGWPQSWTVINGGSSTDTWTDTNPCARDPLPPLIPPFIIADSDCAGSEDMDEQVITPALDFSAYTNARLEFDQYFRYYSGGSWEFGAVEVKSALTGNSWTTKYIQMDFSSPHPDHRVIDITPEVAGANDVQVRWRYYYANDDWYWILDNVKLSSQTGTQCQDNICQDSAAPTEVSPPGYFMTVIKIDSQNIQISYTPACNASNNTIYRGKTTGPFPGINWTEQQCYIGNTGQYTLNTGPLNANELMYFVVAANNNSVEGSYGKNSAGAERPEASALPQCDYPQDLTGSC
ncbi:MAG: hypothetical protein A2Y62_13415 [Candidatus Fischerbacteria bacterium RBG_13_37_8]|uniref:Serine protease n=1 Tax=Candidatus Fischerbacteria bacterium RBG_13_37_8 TaxID=1817863 RepID=A0A1F5VJG2_9BACT|nr:MAG: hypothetical protein A2Y62_13415 [Candidatus Fischerbacteria bacterium RBG_13_37_8]